MSWQSYVDDHLMYEISPDHYLTAAAIIGLDGNVWAQTANFPVLSLQEIEKLNNGFEENSVLPQNGLFLGGQKYMVLQGDPGIVVRGKKGQGGTCVRKTNSAFIIGLYDEPCTPGECNIAVEKLGDYLFDQGFEPGIQIVMDSRLLSFYFYPLKLFVDVRQFNPRLSSSTKEK